MEDPAFIHQYQMQSLGNSVHDEFNFQSLSSESYSSYLSFSPRTSPNFCNSAVDNFQPGEGTAKQLKTNSWESSTSNHLASKPSSSSPSQLISFGNSNLPLSNYIRNFHENPYSSVKPKDEAASLENRNPASVISQSSYHETQNHSPTSGHGIKRVGTPLTKNALNNQDHVLAERKRREKLTQRFIALSAIVPGLKKVIIC